MQCPQLCSIKRCEIKLKIKQYIFTFHAFQFKFYSNFIKILQPELTGNIIIGLRTFFYRFNFTVKFVIQLGGGSFLRFESSGASDGLVFPAQYSPVQSIVRKRQNVQPFVLI